MTDRELLKQAAKAAQIDILWHEGRYKNVTGFAPEMNLYAAKDWNPLTDDSDALRLALQLDIVPRVINGVAFAWRDRVCDMQEPCGNDTIAAIRRAIVRAAAEIGKAMP